MQPNAETASGGAPLFSVVVPTFNRGKILGKMLAAWEAQKPDDLSFEIIAVDDGSTDDTSDVLAAFAARRCRLTSLRQENRGPAAARNTALLSARGHYVLFTGDDIEPSRNLLQRHLEAHRRLDDDRGAIVGKIEWAPRLTLTSTMRHVDGPGAQQFSFAHMRSGEEYDFRHFYTSNVSVSRAMLLREPSGFSIDFPFAAFEDAEYAYRLRRHGMRIVYESSAVAWHHHPYSARQFFRRQVACGNMAAVLIGKWPEVGKLIGFPTYRSCRRRASFLFGRHRRKVVSIEPKLSECERLATDIASNFDLPPTSDVDPLLRGLFEYGYFKGMAESMESPSRALRLTSMRFLDLVVTAVSRLRGEVDPERMEQVESLAVVLGDLSA